MLNKFIIQARLSRNPQLITTEKNKILLFNLACNSSEKKDKVNFLDVKSFGKTAEFINKYFKKGRIGIFEGYISSGAYEKNGEKVFVQDLIVTNVYFNERKESTETQTEENEQTNLKNVDSVLFD